MAHPAFRRQALRLALVLCALAPLEAQSVTIPFVGCPSDGQTGPVAAPKGAEKKLALPPAIAARLAYYTSESGPHVLAPRGWHCFCTYGSSGSSLFVSPEAIGSSELFSDRWHGFDGPAIQASVSVGGTSGRFTVARAIARLFPAHASFVKDVIAEGIEPAGDFPSGPYPADKLKYLTADMVEFQTPAHADGMGTDSRLRKNADPISGVVTVGGEDMDLFQLSVRLPSRLLDLVPFILHQAEQADASPQH